MFGYLKKGNAMSLSSICASFLLNLPAGGTIVIINAGLFPPFSFWSSKISALQR
jgi:ABC-type Mn2+/Zn2+ transport system permease subunit